MDNKPGVGGAPQSKVASETKTGKDKVLIAVLGVTGAGKSTFINTATGLTTLKISHGSQPCTQNPRAVDLKIRHKKQERPIVLIDTPGFDDDKRSDVRILEDIATWMGRKGYVQLDGLIFLHPITFTRAGGSELNRTQLLEKILGLDAYNRVFIATTMWDYIVSEDQVKARLESRLSPGGVWHELTSKGASYDKHQNTQESAHEIIGRIVDISDRLGKPKILLETQLKERKGRVVATDAGMTLEMQIQRRITLLNDQILKHSAERPPGSYRVDKVPEHKKAWKRWHRGQRELQGKLAYEEQQLRRLQNIVVRFFHGLASLFRSNSFR